jgi:hypothetical protein
MVKFIEISTLEGDPLIINKDEIIRVKPIDGNNSKLTLKCPSGNGSYPITISCTLGFEEWQGILDAFKP